MRAEMEAALKRQLLNGRLSGSGGNPGGGTGGEGGSGGAGGWGAGLEAALTPEKVEKVSTGPILICE